MTIINWTPEEEYFLKQNYLTQSKEMILENLKDRTWKAVEHRAKSLGLYKNEKSRDIKRDLWTEEEITIVKENYVSKTEEFFAEKLPHRTWKSIKDKASNLSLNKIKTSDRVKWTEEEDSLLLKIYLESDKNTLQSHFSTRTFVAIRQRAKSLGMLKDETRSIVHENWTDEEILIVKENYVSETEEFFAEKLSNRTWKSIRHKATELNLYKNEKNRDIQRISWTEKELFLLKDHYPHNQKKDIIPLFPNRTWKAIREKANFLNINRDKDLIVKDSTENMIASNIKNYNVKSTFQLDEVKEKSKQTNLENLGVEYPMQSEEVQQKSIDTCQKNWDVDYSFLAKEIEEKGILTMMERYKTTIPMHSKEIKEKVGNTNLERRGVINPFASKEVQEKTRNTMRRKYNKDYPQQVKEIREKTNNTNLDRYGVEAPAQNPIIRDKMYETKCKNKSHQNSKPEEKFLIYLRDIVDSDIIHHKQHPELKYNIDYYSPKYDLWIQFDGIYWHGRYKDREKLKNSPHFAIKRSNTRNIYNAIIRDEIQNAGIPNLIRFWEDDVKQAIKTDSIRELIAENFLKKVS